MPERRPRPKRLSELRERGAGVRQQKSTVKQGQSPRCLDCNLGIDPQNKFEEEKKIGGVSERWSKSSLFDLRMRFPVSLGNPRKKNFGPLFEKITSLVSEML